MHQSLTGRQMIRSAVAVVSVGCALALVAGFCSYLFGGAGEGTNLPLICFFAPVWACWHYARVMEEPFAHYMPWMALTTVALYPTYGVLLSLARSIDR